MEEHDKDNDLLSLTVAGVGALTGDALEAMIVRIYAAIEDYNWLIDEDAIAKSVLEPFYGSHLIALRQRLAEVEVQNLLDETLWNDEYGALWTKIAAPGFVLPTDIVELVEIVAQIQEAELQLLFIISLGSMEPEFELSEWGMEILKARLELLDKLSNDGQMTLAKYILDKWDAFFDYDVDDIDADTDHDIIADLLELFDAATPDMPLIMPVIVPGSQADMLLYDWNSHTDALYEAIMEHIEHYIDESLLELWHEFFRDMGIDEDGMSDPDDIGVFGGVLMGSALLTLEIEMALTMQDMFGELITQEMIEDWQLEFGYIVGMLQEFVDKLGELDKDDWHRVDHAAYDMIQVQISTLETIFIAPLEALLDRLEPTPSP
jgi:hypothetical protein